jgi:putative FmdB family regulatory protein
MPVYDYECRKCGKIEEKILTIKQHEKDHFICICGGYMNPIISASGQYCSNDDATWLKSVTEVVDPTSGIAASEFYKNPSRSNYKAWMKESGIRPLERNEKMRPDPVNLDKVHDEVQRKHHERMLDSEYRRRSNRILKHGHHN